MQKATMRNLVLMGFVGDAVGFVLLIVSGSIDTQSGLVNATIIIPKDNTAAFWAGIVVLFAAFLASLSAWIGGLIRTARLQRWAWFVFMLVLGIIVTLIYGIVASDAPATQTAQSQSSQRR